MFLTWPTGSSAFSEPNTWIVPLLSFLGGAGGGIFGGYLSKRGEIAAISRKLDEVVRQNNRIVEESEEIKTRLSERSWARQRKLELQRDIGVELVGMYGELLSKMQDFNTAALARQRAVDNQDEGARQIAIGRRDNAYREYSEIMQKYVRYRERSRLVFSSDISARVDEEIRSFADIMHQVENDGRFTNETPGLLRIVSERQEDLVTALRREMDIPGDRAGTAAQS
jgi:hypothetical protein